MNQHTASPWTSRPHPTRANCFLVERWVGDPRRGMADEIATIHSAGDSGEANARLIAAAPDLLAALELMQAALTEHHLRDVRKRFSLCTADAAASTAIARAKGNA